MRVLVAIDPIDFRCGIDGIARVCREMLMVDPYSGAMCVFRNRRSTSVKLLVFDGQGFWLCQKRLSVGKFGRWPAAGDGALMASLRAHELMVLLAAGNASATNAAPEWRRVAATA
jgi:transposase